MRRLVSTVIVGFVALLLAQVGVAAGARAGAQTGMQTGPQAAASGPLRILVIGDSVTQGKVGDHTWRYWFWTMLQTAGRDVDLVGPHTGLFDPDTLTYDNAGYADENFDQDHAARWGGSMADFTAIDGQTAAQMVATYRPDVIVNELGINDLAYTATPTQLIAKMRQFVADVRSVDPQVGIVLGQLTQVWHLDGSGQPVVEQYNDLLAQLASDLDAPGAPVVVALKPADYVEYVDTYDPAHPSPSGETKLAQQYFDALMKVPPRPAPPPPPVAGRYTGAGSVAAIARRGAVRLRFSTPTGATRQAVWKRDLSAAGRWRLVGWVSPSVSSLRVSPLRHHHRYAFRLRAYRDTVASDVFSNRVRVRVR